MEIWDLRIALCVRRVRRASPKAGGLEAAAAGWGLGARMVRATIFLAAYIVEGHFNRLVCARVLWNEN